MAYSSISSLAIAVGKAIKKELWDLIKGNFDDHESRLTAVETAGSLIPIFDETVYSATAAASLTAVLFFQAKQAMKVVRVRVQIFDKGSISSGTLEIDCKKSTSLNPAGFATILTTLPSINFATAANYDSDDAVINSSLNTLAIDQYIRIDVTALPTTPLSKFRVIVYGEIDA